MSQDNLPPTHYLHMSRSLKKEKELNHEEDYELEQRRREAEEENWEEMTGDKNE